MKVRKLNGGDNRGHIFTVRDFSITIYSEIKDGGEIKLTVRPYLELVNKKEYVGGDGTSLFEILPPETEETDWEDPRYKEWIATHTFSDNHCDECGKKGSFTRAGFSGCIMYLRF